MYFVYLACLPAMLFSGVELYPNEGWVVAAGDVAADQRGYTVTGLKPARSYQFRISAVNDVGEGPPSQPSVVIALPQERKYHCIA